MNVRLDDIEIRIGTWIGRQRNSASVRRGDLDRLCAPSDKFDGEVAHIWGACAEIAFCKGLGIYWPPSINIFKCADAGESWQVRTRINGRRDLIIRPRDNPEHKYALVLTDYQLTDFELMGWIHGRAAKQAQWRSNPGGHGIAWWIPPEALQPITEIEHHD